MSRVYIILVNWNGWLDTLECMESLLNLDYHDFRIVVCDNGSCDCSLQQIIHWADSRKLNYTEYRREEAEIGGNKFKDSTLTIVHNNENLGFAGGNNVALRYGLARGDADYYWLLNNDTIVQPDALSHLVARMQEDPMVGMCGSTILMYDNHMKTQALGGGYY